MSFPVDDMEDISVSLDYPYSYSQRRVWDCYFQNSGSLWGEYDDDDIFTVSFFNDGLKKQTTRFYALRIAPSQARFRLYTEKGISPTVQEITDTVEQFVKDNIGWYNSVKKNHIDDPLPCPPEIQFLD